MSAEKRPWTEAELDAAAEKVCVGGYKAGIAFFGRHPDLGFRVAVELQCEHTALYEALANPVGDDGEAFVGAGIARMGQCNTLDAASCTARIGSNFSAGGREMNEQFLKWWCGPARRMNTGGYTQKIAEMAWDAALSSRAGEEMPKLDVTEDEQRKAIELMSCYSTDRHTIRALAEEKFCRELQLRESYALVSSLRSQIEAKDAPSLDAVAEVRKRLANAPDDDWVKLHCPIELEFAERMIKAEAALSTAERDASGLREVRAGTQDRVP